MKSAGSKLCNWCFQTLCPLLLECEYDDCLSKPICSNCVREPENCGWSFGVGKFGKIGLYCPKHKCPPKNNCIKISIMRECIVNEEESDYKDVEKTPPHESSPQKKKKIKLSIIL